MLSTKQVIKCILKEEMMVTGRPRESNTPGVDGQQILVEKLEFTFVPILVTYNYKRHLTHNRARMISLLMIVYCLLRGYSI